ncbi:MAG: PBSX family phage terminase large subunit [Lawsonibacter sp.]
MTTSPEIRLSNLVAPAFYEVHADIKSGGHTHFWLPGGRGSGKSSFVSIEIPLGMMRDAERGRLTHGVVLRRYAVTLRESVYAQLLWGIHALGVGRLWQANVAPMALTYLPTGQKILFRGADDPMKVKSIKVDRGYIKYGWYEEVNEFEGEEKLRSINQSLMRGGEDFTFFYTFNPPKSARNWCNQYVAASRPDTLVNRSTYLSVPPAWLGEQFIAEAEHLKTVKPEAYAHEYLGEITGTGGEVFDNITLRLISEEGIGRFDRIRRGLDWGYASDPLAYNEGHYDKSRRRLYLYRELHQVRLSNRKAAELIVPWAGNSRIICDSAEPKSIDEMRDYGLRVVGAKKGPDSVEYGIKWLQDLEEIVIDPERCPETAREFSGYELDRDKDGNFKAGFPDHDNHHIDAVRYACEDDMKRPTLRVLK